MLGQCGPTAGRRSVGRIAAAVLLATVSASCGDLQRQGQASSYLIVNNLVGASGSSTLASDVMTAGSIDSDLGTVTFDLAMKDPGSAIGPTTANYITVNQYHVKYIRTDGRNVEGVDVPYSFDGGMTITVNGTGVTGTFTIVRNIAKNEAPLRALAANGLVISTIAEVTFYGHDQTGREVSAMARLSIDFANFAD